MPQLRHQITNNVNGFGTCSICGPVKLWRSGHRWRCSVDAKQYKFKRKYAADVSREDVNKLGPCEICHDVTRLLYDHDHETGAFRGWLCPRCNTGLGFARDSTEILQSMIAYLCR